MDSTKAVPLTRDALKAFYPPDGKSSKYCRDLTAALALLPFRTLPKFLFPKQDRVLNPPIFHCGYVHNWEWAEEFAKEHNLLVVLNDLGEDFVCEEATLEKVMDYITKEAGITTFKLIPDNIYGIPGLPKKPVLMSIVSNYRRFDQLPGKPDWNDVKKLQKYLGRTDRPMWYLDLHYRGWDRRSWKERV